MVQIHDQALKFVLHDDVLVRGCLLLRQQHFLIFCDTHLIGVLDGGIFLLSLGGFIGGILILRGHSQVRISCHRHRVFQVAAQRWLRLGLLLFTLPDLGLIRVVVMVPLHCCLGFVC